ncbi:MAG: glycosyltransferase [Proteobacteria bacterium]|nr:MAG: glycosyltransferase [Pseudomonadota bacterium]
MKITHVIWAKYPLWGYGGTERAAYWLAKAQAEMGHEVTVLCLPGSELPFAKCLPIPENFSHLDPLLPEGTEFVQLYSTPAFRIDAPYLVVVQGNGQAGEKYDPRTVFVSANHAARHGWSEFVHNGLDPAEYPIGKKKDGSALFLAKAKWRVKNLKGAIPIARAAGMRLHVAGGRAGWWKRGVTSHGDVGGPEKMALLQNCSALLFPIIWEEPFGIAVIEALVSGTPAVVTPRGSMPEIVNASCGAIGNSFDELVEGLRHAQTIAPEAARARVLEAFTHHHMANKYLSYYQKILSLGKLREGAPQAAANADPQAKTYYKQYR